MTANVDSATGTFEVEATVIVRVTVNDPDVVARVVRNEEGWRERFYGLQDKDDVIEHLAYNGLVNNRDAHELDGWADLPAGSTAAELIDWLPESVREVAP